MEESIEILQTAYENGINFYDTAHFYTDSEEKIGRALSDVREDIFLASKSGAESVEEFWSDLETSLKSMKTDYLDLHQFHNISFCPKEDDDLYKAMLEAKDNGMIKHIGITTHKITFAHEALDSGLYETLQYPFSYLSGKEELELVEKCKKLDVGFIAMKAMGGGLIKNSKAEKDKKELGENFCRGCGYCMPCPEEINISLCARMSLWIRRFPTEPNMDERTQEIMKKTLDCVECYECVDKCPYELDIPELLKENYEDYQNVLTGKTKII